MPCWSGKRNVVLKIVLFCVLETGWRSSRWNGESMVNSNWIASSAEATKGARRSKEYSDSSMLNV